MRTPASAEAHSALRHCEVVSREQSIALRVSAGSGREPSRGRGHCTGSVCTPIAARSAARHFLSARLSLQGGDQHRQRPRASTSAASAHRSGSLAGGADRIRGSRSAGARGRAAVVACAGSERTSREIPASVSALPDPGMAHRSDCNGFGSRRADGAQLRQPIRAILQVETGWRDAA